MNQQNWQAQQYRKNASFVAQLGTPIIELLAPQKTEKILDLGCGDGKLTLAMQQYGCDVLGVDSSISMVKAAKQLGLNVRVLSGESLDFNQEFDAVFSNAALHWMTNLQQVVAKVYQALKPQGRFVGEFGGQGNIQCLVATISAIFQDFPEFGEFNNPWYFPSVVEYSEILTKAGFNVEYIELIPRPTPLSNGIVEWLQIFANGITSHLSKQQQQVFLQEAETRLRPLIFSETQGWVADYVRLRFKVIKNT
ncbi:MAG TPA: class I SAM-dependent methyltransferase [Xenococcaceae cyanobacterium]|jgi:2-isopropylmalate synthase